METRCAIRLDHGHLSVNGREQNLEIYFDEQTRFAHGGQFIKMGILDSNWAVCMSIPYMVSSRCADVHMLG